MSGSDQKIRVGIVGLGRAGWHLHFKPMSVMEGFQIAAVADLAAERRLEAKELTGCETYSSIDDLLKGASVDVVVVATPSKFHAEDAIKVLESGAHCIIEKPFGLSFSEIRRVLDLAEKKKLKVFVHHNHLHGSEFRHLKDILERGVLGEIFHLRVFWGWFARRWDWQTLSQNGGGQLYNTCPHTLSLVLPLLGGNVTTVYSDLRNIKDAGDAEDHVHLVLRSDNGATADVVVSSAIGAVMPRWLICGSNGTLTSDGKKTTVRYYDPSSVPKLSVLDEAAPNRQYLSEELPWQEEVLEVADAPSSSFHQNVFDVLSLNKPQVVTPESAAEVVRITELAKLQSTERPELVTARELV